jgi:hypothetical protein
MSKLDKALQALLVALSVAASVFVKNPASQAQATKFLNLGASVASTISSLRSIP